MDVVLTDHAWTRCRQRKIDPILVKTHLSTLPYFEGEMFWQVAPNVMTRISNINGKCVVVTVHDGKRMKKNGNQWKCT